MMKLLSKFRRENIRQKTLVQGQVVPIPGLCIQCGVCSFHCPIEIDIRRHAWEGIPVKTSQCLTCGECVARCPRGVLRFERSEIYEV
jgi:ferredoxin